MNYTFGKMHLDNLQHFRKFQTANQASFAWFVVLHQLHRQLARTCFSKLVSSV